MLGIRGKRRRPVLKLVKKRSRLHLLPHIKKHVKCGTTIASDHWRAYNCLKDHGYNHLPVNHQWWFVDPATGAHTQHIERLWAACKSEVWRLRGNRNSATFKDHLHVIQWAYWRGKAHRDGPLGMLFHDIRKKYRFC